MARPSAACAASFCLEQRELIAAGDAARPPEVHDHRPAAQRREVEGRAVKRRARDRRRRLAPRDCRGHGSAAPAPRGSPRSWTSATAATATPSPRRIGRRRAVQRERRGCLLDRQRPGHRRDRMDRADERVGPGLQRGVLVGLACRPVRVGSSWMTALPRGVPDVDVVGDAAVSWLLKRIVNGLPAATVERLQSNSMFLATTARVPGRRRPPAAAAEAPGEPSGARRPRRRSSAGRSRLDDGGQHEQRRAKTWRVRVGRRRSGMFSRWPVRSASSVLRYSAVKSMSQPRSVQTRKRTADTRTQPPTTRPPNRAPTPSAPRSGRIGRPGHVDAGRRAAMDDRGQRCGWLGDVVVVADRLAAPDEQRDDQDHDADPPGRRRRPRGPANSAPAPKATRIGGARAAGHVDVGRRHRLDARRRPTAWARASRTRGPSARTRARNSSARTTGISAEERVPVGRDEGGRDAGAVRGLRGWREGTIAPGATTRRTSRRSGRRP